MNRSGYSQFRRVVFCCVGAVVWGLGGVFAVGAACAWEGLGNAPLAIGPNGIKGTIVGGNNTDPLVLLRSGSLVRSKRASAEHVGAVMAMLGTFYEAGVLPPEADPRANQLIRALIQFQSVFLKSEEPAVHAYLASALSRQWGEQAETIRSSFYAQGWSSESLEAVVEYSVHQSMRADPGMQSAIQSYYLSPADWTLIQGVFLEARQRLESQHQNIHAVFARQRLGMPGRGLPPN